MNTPLQPLTTDRKIIICPFCKGLGKHEQTGTMYETVCTRCKGKGRVKQVISIYTFDEYEVYEEVR